MTYQNLSGAGPRDREQIEKDLLEYLADCFPGLDAGNRIAGIKRLAIMNFMAPRMQALLDVLGSFELAFQQTESAPEALLLGALIIVSNDFEIIPGVRDPAYEFPELGEIEDMGAEPEEEDAFIFPIPYNRFSTLLLIEPQARLQDMRLDFLLTLKSPWWDKQIITKVMVECDSMAHHTSHRQMICDRHRDQKVQAEDIYSFRIMASEILDDPFAVAHQAINFMKDRT